MTRSEDPQGKGLPGDAPRTSESIDELVARSEIAELLARLCHARDRRRWWLMPALFNPMATAVEPRLSGPGWQAFAAQLAAAAKRIEVSHHQLGNLQVAMHGDHAMAECYVTIFQRLYATTVDDLSEPSLSGGRYIDRFERRQGTWRIAEHRFVPDLHCGPLSGLAVSASPVDAAQDPSIAVVARWKP